MHIHTKIFLHANHHLKNSFNPAIDKELDWPRLIDGYDNYIQKWLDKKP
ncbi:MAG: hypothetical protein JEZ09_20315 [Salinivirgaceae bacterium]|nr:hypothetical protein [Salinivirgaceae bacterium]